MRDTQTHPLASLAIETLSTAKWAKVHKEQQLLVNAAQKYAQALVALRDSLSNSQGYDFDTVAAITALSRYELLVCTVYRGWIQHYGGISEMVEIIGPAPFNQYPYKAILESNRFRIMHEAYFRRKPTFLRQESWQSGWESASDTDTCFNKLQDLYGDLTEVAAQATFIEQHDAENWQERQNVLVLANNLVQDLDTWAEEWQSIRNFVPSKIANDAKDAFYSDCDGLVFEESLQYPTLRDAVGMNMCKTIKLTALEWQKRLQDSSWWAGSINENMVDITEARLIVEDICRSLHLHFDSTGGVSDTYYLLYGAISALKGFPRNSRETSWLQGLLVQIADLTGIELARIWHNNYENKWKP